MLVGNGRFRMKSVYSLFRDTDLIWAVIRLSLVRIFLLLDVIRLKKWKSKQITPLTPQSEEVDSAAKVWLSRRKP